MLYFVVFRQCQDTSDPRHFGTMRLVPKCPDSSAPVPNCLDLQRTFLLQWAIQKKGLILLVIIN